MTISCYQLIASLFLLGKHQSDINDFVISSGSFFLETQLSIFTRDWNTHLTRQCRYMCRQAKEEKHFPYFFYCCDVELSKLISHNLPLLLFSLHLGPYGMRERKRERKYAPAGQLQPQFILFTRDQLIYKRLETPPSWAGRKRSKLFTS